jgi:hypothetical protein
VSQKIPTTFGDCRELVKEKIAFTFTHVFAELKDGFTAGYNCQPPIYTIYSFSRNNPILVFDFGREKWAGLKDAQNDKITQLHMSLAGDAPIDFWMPHEELVNISRYGLPGGITNPKFTPDKFVKARDPKELLAEYIAENGPVHDHPVPGATIPRINIKNPQWYHKVVDMLAHNYATISEDLSGKTSVYFFYDGGRHYGRLPKFISLECIEKVFKSTSCIIDSLEFKNTQIAKEKLNQNGFELITQELDQKFMGHLSAHKPKGESFFDMRDFNKKLYSSEDFWV